MAKKKRQNTNAPVSNYWFDNVTGTINHRVMGDVSSNIFNNTGNLR